MAGRTSSPKKGGLQDFSIVEEKLSELNISDDSSGALPKRGGDHSKVFREVSRTFYGLALADGEELVEEGTLVFEDLKEALLKLRSYKRSRLKGFPNEAEALAFASAQVQDENLSDRDRTEVTRQMLIELRKTIENGEAKAFAQMVWNNPRILIGRTENPSVLEEGTRMNAIHIAAKYDQPILCQLILDILQNRQFLEKLYPRETSKRIRKRRHHLLDLYLNTPDKMLGDTPLHYASKFGSLECVIILVAHEFSTPDSKNIDDKTPAEIICSLSKQADVTLIFKIQEAFKLIYYVTILRIDDILSPSVVERPSLKRNVLDAIRTDGEHDILNKTALKITAFAGPMTMEKADTFYQLLKNPSFESLGNFMYETKDLIVLSQIRKTDPEKGLHRIARLLADDLNVDYMEFFPMLNLFTNLSKKEGLLTLEKYINGLPNSCPDNIALPAAEESVVAAYLDPKAHVNSFGHDINVHLQRERYKKITSSKLFFTLPCSKDSEQAIANTPNLLIDGGFSLTRQEVYALLAVRSNDVCVDEKTFPSVYRWKKRVEKKLKKCKADREKMKRLSPLASIVIPRVVYIGAQSAASSSPEQD